MNNSGQVVVVIVIGLIGGLAVGIQGPMSGAISQKLGPVAASFIIHLGGAVASGLLLILLAGQNLKAWQDQPFPYFFAGIFGLILYLTLNYTLPRIGAGNSITLLVAAELITALIIDQFGWFGVPAQPTSGLRLIGGVLLIVAASLIAR